MENELIFLHQGKVPVVDSRLVAQRFGKRHDNIVRSVRNLLGDLNALKIEGIDSVAIPSTYVDEKKRNKVNFLLPRRGFDLVVMGMSGKDALKHKLYLLDRLERLELQVQASSSNSIDARSADILVEAMLRNEVINGSLKTINSIRDLEKRSDDHLKARVNDRKLLSAIVDKLGIAKDPPEYKFTEEQVEELARNRESFDHDYFYELSQRMDITDIERLTGISYNTFRKWIGGRNRTKPTDPNKRHAKQILESKLKFEDKMILFRVDDSFYEEVQKNRVLRGTKRNIYSIDTGKGRFSGKRAS